eukprot:scaffold177921_cov21-Tisochrysis_lutea.AAC.1
MPGKVHPNQNSNGAVVIDRFFKLRLRSGYGASMLGPCNLWAVYERELPCINEGKEDMLAQRSISPLCHKYLGLFSPATPSGALRLRDLSGYSNVTYLRDSSL